MQRLFIKDGFITARYPASTIVNHPDADSSVIVLPDVPIAFNSVIIAAEEQFSESVQATALDVFSRHSALLSASQFGATIPPDVQSELDAAAALYNSPTVGTYNGCNLVAPVSARATPLSGDYHYTVQGGTINTLRTYNNHDKDVIVTLRGSGVAVIADRGAKFDNCPVYVRDEDGDPVAELNTPNEIAVFARGVGRPTETNGGWKVERYRYTLDNRYELMGV